MAEKTAAELDALLNKLLGAFERKMPFNQLLGIQFEALHLDEVRLRLEMREELIGNYVHGMLHGGVIASVLDVAGGMIAMANAFSNKELTDNERREGLDRASTIDMRVDYLRPGKGAYFIATAQVLRGGRRVSVTRMALHNDQGVLIAVGTGSYIVG